MCLERTLNMLDGLLGFEWQLGNFSEFTPKWTPEGNSGNYKDASILNCSKEVVNIMNGLHLQF